MMSECLSGVMLFGLVGVFAISGDSSMIDERKLMEYRKKTAVAGIYLQVWDRVNAHLKSSANIKLDEYIITFDEDESHFLVKLSKPFKEPALGGGVGVCMVNKQTHQIQCNLAR